ncbi:MAG TPA: glutamate--tRNA ligase [Dehalococcoidia bacterium]
MTVRVRFAPSPTGLLHVGNLRTALFNWLFARHHGGRFIVRVEDTDRARLVPGAVEYMLEALRWLELDWDEGPEVGGPHAPYVQSERLDLYQGLARRLVDEGAAYECYCTPERLEALRREQAARKEPPGYDRRCRTPEGREQARRENPGGRPVVRFAIPLEGTTTVHDLIRGDVTFENARLDDFVMLKSDGFPTYHLAATADDHVMEISHVLRGEDWLASTPRHLLLYRALGWEPPRFAHLPMILGKDRAKLSKRHGATEALAYRDQGYLPEALFNFLGLLGWSLDDKTEIISREEFVRHFDVDRIGRNPAIFDMEKLTWMNGVYIRQMPPHRLAAVLAEWLERDLPPEVPRPLDRAYVERMVPLIQERIKLLSEAAELTAFFFTPGVPAYDAALLLGKRFQDRPAEALRALETAVARLRGVDAWDAAALEAVLRPLAEELGLKAGDLFGVVRVAVTGRTVAPPLFETMEVLGRERCLERMEAALGRLAALAR